MNKSIAVVVLGGALALGAFWLGRLTDNNARAGSPVVEPVSVAVPTARSVRPRPVLSVKQPAPGLAADLVAADPKIRRAAVAEAASDPQVVLAASRDPDPDVARTAIAALNKLYADGQIEPKQMIALATDRALPDRVRLLAINGVGTVQSADTAAMLVTMLGGSTIERRSASALLGNQDPELAVPALIKALSDEDEYVRMQAADSLKLFARGRDFGQDAGAWQAWWQARR